MPFPVAYTVEKKGSTYFQSPRSPAPKPPKMVLPLYLKVNEDDYRPHGGRHEWIDDTVRNHLVAMIGEFIGTMMFLFFGFTGAQIANSKPQALLAGCLLSTNQTQGLSLEQLLYISIGFGISLAVNVWIFYRVSGGAFNPAVTLGLCLSGAVPWARGALLVPVQIVAGIIAAFLVSVLFPGELQAAVSLGNGTNTLQGLFIEMILTAELIFTILMLAVEKHRATFAAPLGIGMALFVGHFAAIEFTGAGLNPARAFGTAVVLNKFPTYHWIYWLGPVLGAILAAMLYKIIKILEYETSNAGQDDDGRDVYQVLQRRGDTFQVPGYSTRRKASMDSTFPSPSRSF